MSLLTWPAGFSKWKKVSGGNWKIAGAPIRRVSGAGRQSPGCGRGFPPPAGGGGGGEGYEGPPPEKNENLHALRCILVHFQDQKVIF